MAFKSLLLLFLIILLNACGEGSESDGDDDQGDTTDTTVPEITLLGANFLVIDISSSETFSDRGLVDTLIDEHLSVGEPQRIIYVAPLSGTTDGTGSTREDPRRNLKAALEAALPGDHFYLAPGGYHIDEARDTFGSAIRHAA
jgi:hypothetical protein